MITTTIALLLMIANPVDETAPRALISPLGHLAFVPAPDLPALAPLLDAAPPFNPGVDTFEAVREVLRVPKVGGRRVCMP